MQSPALVDEAASSPTLNVVPSAESVQPRKQDPSSLPSQSMPGQNPSPFAAIQQAVQNDWRMVPEQDGHSEAAHAPASNAAEPHARVQFSEPAEDLVHRADPLLHASTESLTAQEDAIGPEDQPTLPHPSGMHAMAAPEDVLAADGQPGRLSLSFGDMLDARGPILDSALQDDDLVETGSLPPHPASAMHHQVFPSLVPVDMPPAASAEASASVEPPAEATLSGMMQRSAIVGPARYSLAGSETDSEITDTSISDDDGSDSPPARPILNLRPGTSPKAGTLQGLQPPRNGVRQLVLKTPSPPARVAPIGRPTSAQNGILQPSGGPPVDASSRSASSRPMVVSAFANGSSGRGPADSGSAHMSGDSMPAVIGNAAAASADVSIRGGLLHDLPPTLASFPPRPVALVSHRVTLKFIKLLSS